MESLAAGPGSLTAGWPVGPARPQRPVDEVHVWLADLSSDWPGPAGLPAPERERAEAFRRPEAAARWTAARWALRTILGRYLDQDPAQIELSLGEQGKPHLVGAADALSFNLSHSGSLALVVVAAGREVGVDVERIDPRRDVLALAERALGPEGAAAVRAAPSDQRQATFFARWTEHEARLKCLGTGLGTPPPKQVPVAVRLLDVDQGYAAAVAVAGERLPACRCYSLR
jgi:4'-phosphopantetheinyl transferase